MSIDPHKKNAHNSGMASENIFCNSIRRVSHFLIFPADAVLLFTVATISNLAILVQRYPDGRQIYHYATPNACKVLGINPSVPRWLEGYQMN